MPFASYYYVKLLLKLGGKLRLRVFERGGSRKVLGTKRKAVRRDYVFMMRSFMVFFSSKDITRIIISSMMRLAALVAGTGETDVATE